MSFAQITGFWPLLTAFAAGACLGAFFFGGLWWTVQRLPTTRRPALLFLGSFAVRTAVVLAGIYLVTAGQWLQVISCVAGFIVMRTILTRRWGPSTASDTHTARA